MTSDAELVARLTHELERQKVPFRALPEQFPEGTVVVYNSPAVDLLALANAAMPPSISRDTEVTEAMLSAAYEEGVEDGIGWHCYPESGPKPQWIDSVARFELLQSLAMSAEAPR